MKLETFFEKFELFADAPGAVGKMRELVLRLAFSGGFTGRMLDHDGLLSEWKDQTIASICSSITPGFACSRSHQTADGHVHLRTHNISTLGTLNFDLIVRVDPKMIDAKKASIRQGDILFNNTNSQELVGKTSLVDHDYDYGFSNHITRLRLKEGIYPGYVVYYLTLLRNSGYFAKICTRWINQAAVNSNTLKELTIPLPSLAEQKRIVAKVDELMALCDQLEAQQQERETQHNDLARATLARFADAPTPANLNFLFHPSYTITPADLRKTILTLAVQGKLVPQYPDDEPVEELITRISKIRQAMKAKQYEPVLEDDVPYEVPFSWTWVRLGNISLSSDSGWSPQCVPQARSGTDWGVLKVSAVSWSVFKPEENKALPLGVDARPGCEVRPGDFLLSRANTEELVARSVVVGQTPPRLMMSDKIVRFTFPDEIDKAFINLANSSDQSRAYYARNASGTSSSMKNVGRTVMCSLPIPLPPLAEQRRIVAKVDQLMALVDELEARLAASRTAGENLLAALVADLTGTANGRKFDASPIILIAPAPQSAVQGVPTATAIKNIIREKNNLTP
ncbi:restriction endonuclease subunit S [Desulfonatronum lacustre]|uniref:restriction endonuclease subunit S n=1 Tax=Desulfonatronum lacustre TaxID=66849 RepID=UPI0004B6B0EF|nr:restriction endonuclease subunit S [Desulfonatronum lacustre]